VLHIREFALPFQRETHGTVETRGIEKPNEKSTQRNQQDGEDPSVTLLSKNVADPFHDLLLSFSITSFKRMAKLILLS
jgi:hypothetical protein